MKSCIIIVQEINQYKTRNNAEIEEEHIRIRFRCKYCWCWIGKSVTNALCVFGKRGPKMFNFELLFLHGFSSKNREILHKAVLTPQEYEEFFFWKKNQEKSVEKIKKLVGGVSASQEWSQKNPLAKRIFFRKCTFCGNTPK